MLEFSKKQLSPLISKWRINPVTDETFQWIVKTFYNQTPYQIWAIKLIYSGICSRQTIEKINQFANTYQNEIKNLLKGNIISYKTSSDIQNLMSEMDGLVLINNVKNSINRFNTSQREMLRNNILSNINNGLDALRNRNFMEWADMLKKMEKLVPHKKAKLISVASAITSINVLKEHIMNALKASYEWEKEDMLAFMQNNASDCKVVFDHDNIVVISVPSFTSSRTMCGNGRTAWCLTREESYFKQYVLNPSDAIQYFLFDFSKREDDELAHVGFTVRKGLGIVNAHSTCNNNLLGDGINYNGRRININQVLTNLKVPRKLLTPVSRPNYWNDGENIAEYFVKAPRSFKIISNKDGKLVVKLLSSMAKDTVLLHSMIRGIDFNGFELYVIIDTNVPYDDDNSIILLQFMKDDYGTLSLKLARNTFNEPLAGADLEKLGINVDEIIEQKEIEPRLLLHKLIDEKREKAAIDLVNSNKELDVNFEFKHVLPIFKATEFLMFDLFNTIIKHPNFKSTSSDTFGETLLQSLMYCYLQQTTNTNKTNIRNLIMQILECDTFDFNAKDINLDTALNISCDTPQLNWVTEKLLEKPNVDINCVNDFNCSALGTAIRKKNIAAIKLLASRRDLIIREDDIKLAEKVGIDLKSLINIDEYEYRPSSAEDKEINDLASIFYAAFNM